MSVHKVQKNFVTTEKLFVKVSFSTGAQSLNKIQLADASCKHVLLSCDEPMNFLNI